MIKIHHIFTLTISLTTLFLFSLKFTGCSIPIETTKADTTSYHDIGPIIRKPNVYIYPPNELNLIVKIHFPNGGRVIKSIPEYKRGWNITVDSSGRINDSYRYLFYECTAPDLYQYETGWVIHKDSLTTFFRNHLKQTGFSGQEINDFIEYWIPILNASDYYAIYPQYKETLAPIVQLNFSIIPNHLLRLFYVIKQCTKDVHLQPPSARPPFNRTGFYVVEWGVIQN
jgi:hypothetical protein